LQTAKDAIRNTTQTPVSRKRIGRESPKFNLGSEQ
jgi:hypothetical protein